jgi:hypothetical protein
VLLDLLRVAMPAPFSRKEHYSLQAAMSKLRLSRSRCWGPMSHHCNPQGTFLSNASHFPEEHCFICRFPGFGHLSFDKSSMKMNIWHRWNDDRGRTALLEEKPVPMPFCPPQISHGLARDRNLVSAVRSHQSRSPGIYSSMSTRV